MICEIYSVEISKKVPYGYTFSMDASINSASDITCRDQVAFYGMFYEFECFFMIINRFYENLLK